MFRLYLSDFPLKLHLLITVMSINKRVVVILRSKDAVELPPVAEVDLISPLPSPADPLPQARKAATGDAPTSRMNLRRKRMMENIFTKPITRRKKL